MSLGNASNERTVPVSSGERPAAAHLIREADGYVFSLERDTTLIGRAETSDLAISDPIASRQHAQIVRQPFGHTIRDAQSQNGTVVNQKMLAAGEAHPLRDGDRIQIGSSRWRFHDPAATRRVPGLGRAAAALPISLDQTSQAAYVRGQQLHLAPKEFSLLALLTERPGQVRERAEIAQAIWPEFGGAVSSYNIDVLVSRLRQRLVGAAGPEAAAWLVTVKKRGYRFAADRDPGEIG